MNTLTQMFAVVQTYAPLLMSGACMTIFVWIITCIISIFFGVLFGILSCKKLQHPFMRWLLNCYIVCAKGIPAYVQILIVYFVLPQIVPFSFSPLVAGIIALGFCSAGYMTEIIRSAINTVQSGQWDACFVLGYTTPLALRRIILPQMFASTISPISGELEQLLKSSSLLSTIGVLEITRVAQNIVARELNALSVYLSIAIFYIAISLIISLITKKIERSLS
ncbi:MAG: L-cystine transport system permease protein TcyB [Candidatus Dependentiae bacterium ADurb.Bin331]|nr:MAG: L-cystine transport system permease protein TcyB [Candidatus Dependentiae bacterium ADurb.Bin331]